MPMAATLMRSSFAIAERGTGGESCGEVLVSICVLISLAGRITNYSESTNPGIRTFNRGQIVNLLDTQVKAGLGDCNHSFVRRPGLRASQGYNHGIRTTGDHAVLPRSATAEESCRLEAVEFGAFLKTHIARRV
jgi:hypothetical protein